MLAERLDHWDGYGVEVSFDEHDYFRRVRFLLEKLLHLVWAGKINVHVVCDGLCHLCCILLALLEHGLLEELIHLVLNDGLSVDLQLSLLGFRRVPLLLVELGCCWHRSRSMAAGGVCFSAA